MISFSHVSKRYGPRLAVDDLTVELQTGHVTGLLGPNGAGKSTSMRLLLGLDHPTAGTVTVDGRPYAQIRHPMRVVGAHLDGPTMHPGRTARAHLLGLARYTGLGRRRVEAVLDQVGLSAVAGRRVGRLSLGMRQRLGLAAALLGDPQVLILDEPFNGLDTDGVRWLRDLLTGFAHDGRLVLVSSHLLAEMQQTADRVVVLGRGQLIADCPVDSLTAGDRTVLLRSPADLTALTAALEAAGFTVTSRPGELVVDGADIDQVGELAFSHRVPLHTLAVVPGTLEDGYLRLVRDHVEFSASASVAA